MIFENNGKKLAEMAMKQFFMNQEDERWRALTQLVDFYENDHIPYIMQKLERKPESNDSFPYYFLPLTRHIIKKKSLVYKKAPTRDMSDNYLEITKRKDRWMKEAERQTRLMPVVAMRPLIREGEKVFDYQIVRQFKGFCDPENLSKFKAISYLVGYDEKSSHDRLWAYWDDENYVIVDDGGTPVKNQEMYGGRADKKNPYGEIPFAFFRFNNVIDDCWVGGAFDLVNNNWNIDIAMSDINWMHRYAMFKQPVIIGNPNDLSKVKFGFNEAVMMTRQDSPQGQQSSFDFVDLQANFENAFYIIQKELEMISLLSGVSLNWELKGTPSGFSLVVKNMDLLMDWEDDIDFCRQWERDLFDKEKLVYETDAKGTISDTEVHVNFADIKFPVDPKETREQTDWEIKNNYSTGIDYMRTQDQDATDEDLKKKREDNAEYNGEYNSTSGTTLLTEINT